MVDDSQRAAYSALMGELWRTEATAREQVALSMICDMAVRADAYASDSMAVASTIMVQAVMAERRLDALAPGLIVQQELTAARIRRGTPAVPA